MARTTSFQLEDTQQQWIQEQVAAGKYGSASEAMRVALDRLAEEQRKEEALLSALDKGLASRRAKPGVFSRLKKKHGIR